VSSVYIEEYIEAYTEGYAVKNTSVNNISIEGSLIPRETLTEQVVRNAVTPSSVLAETRPGANAAFTADKAISEGRKESIDRSALAEKTPSQQPTNTSEDRFPRSFRQPLNPVYEQE
jgi:hypothetical protein